MNTKYDKYNFLVPVFSKLESLQLRFCDISDKIFNYLKYCTKLTKLDVSHNPKISGIGFKLLPDTIIELNLNFCGYIKPLHFIKMCKVAKLKKLNIQNCYLLKYSALEELSKIPTLEAIGFSVFDDTIDLRCIARIQNLKELHIDSGNPGNLFYEELAKQKSVALEKFSCRHQNLNEYQKDIICNLKSLKVLCIDDLEDDEFLHRLANENVNLTHLSVESSRRITHGGMLNFVENAKNIKQIDISDCVQFDSNFVLKLIKKLSNLQRPNHLKLIVVNPHMGINKNFRHLLRLCSRYDEDNKEEFELHEYNLFMH